MTLTFESLHPTFVAEVSPVDLRTVFDRDALEQIRAGMDCYAILVFRDQAFSGREQVEFAQRFDGQLHAKTGASAITRNRFGNEALTDISNVDEGGELLESNDRRRQYLLGNRLWHTDASFQDPPGRYSMLYSVVVPPVPADTEFADMRTAYDALTDDMKAQLEGLRAQHSIAYSRATLGFEFSEKESEALKGAVHPLVRTLPNGRKSLYLASHASSIIDWPLAEARLLLRDLTEHATQQQFIYRHSWRVGDLVILDNRAIMHPRMPVDHTEYRREFRRVTPHDGPLPVHRVHCLFPR